MEFEDKVVWVTGASSGIGRATALAFAREGAKVVVSARRVERLEEVARAIDAAGGQGLALACDVTEEAQLERCVGDLLDRFGQLDVALANAGFSVMGRVEKLTAEDWRRQLDVNVVGAAMTAKHALGPLRKTKGRLGLVGSIAAFLAVPRLGAYSASKHAVRALGQTLSIELHGSGVSCTTVHPGYVESDIARVDNRGRLDPDRRDKRPKHLLWSAEDAADVIVEALRDRRRELVFTAHGKVAAFLGQHLPAAAQLMMRRF